LATHKALKNGLQALLDNGHRIPEGTTAQRIGKHWEAYLEPFTDEEIETAIHKVILTRLTSAWPPIAVIVSSVPRVENKKRLDSLEDADEVFGEVLDLVAARGSYSPPTDLEYDMDPIRSRAIASGVRAAGGWKSLCRGTERELASQRASFRAAFKSNSAKAKINGQWDPSRALSAGVDISGILEHMEIGN
jgi:hypothetical protein